MTRAMTSERVDSFRTRWREEAKRTGLNPRDVDVLLADTLQRSPSYLISHGEEVFDPSQIEALLARRLAGEPLQYIRGRSEFYGREFLVDDRVLIPRPETELLVETVLLRAPRHASVVDVGTGSGCIAVTLERERPDLRVLATDRSPASLAVAKQNARRLQSHIQFVASDVLTGFRNAFDVVVSNPPYIPAADVELLDREVRTHEPRSALTPGVRGTEMIERIFDSCGASLVVLEIGYGQEAAVRIAAGTRQIAIMEVRNDFAGIPRVVVSSGHGWK